jgi:hypothetical protein
MEVPPDRRREPRVRGTGTAIVERIVAAERFELAIRDLSVRGVQLVGRATLVEGERVRVVLELPGGSIALAADVVRTDLQRSQAVLAFRDVPADALASIQRSIEALIASARGGGPAAVVVLHPPGDVRDALERDLARLGKPAHVCGTLVEALWALQAQGARCDAIVIGGDAAGELLAHLADAAPDVRRVLLFGGQLESIDHAAASRVDAVLRTPWRIRALARAIGVDSPDTSMVLLPVDGEE